MQSILLAACEVSPRFPPMEAILDYARRMEPPLEAQEVEEVLAMTLRQTLIDDGEEAV